jgi:hypothetical protein
LSDQEYDQVFDLEKVLDLNIAAALLKKQDFAGAISHCKMVRLVYMYLSRGFLLIL